MDTVAASDQKKRRAWKGKLGIVAVCIVVAILTLHVEMVIENTV
jgi:hypothetical protein